MSRPTLSGTVNLGRTVITVPDQLPGSLASLDVQHRNAPAAVRAQEQALAPAAAAGGGSGALTLDLTVNANNQIFVTGRGLDAELGGSLRLTGSTAAPQAVGQFTLRRGPALHPRQAADLHARHDRLRGFAGAEPRFRCGYGRAATPGSQ